MKRVTADQIISWDPCWKNADSRARQLVSEPVSGLDILTRQDGEWEYVDPQDRLWLVLHDGVIDEPTMCNFSCDCAERALMRERAAGRDPDPRSWNATAVARRFVEGKATSDDLLAAMAAAEAASSKAWHELATRAASSTRAARSASAASAALAARSASCTAQAAWHAQAQQAAQFVLWAASSARAALGGEAAAAERRWQVERLAALLAAIERHAA